VPDTTTHQTASEQSPAAQTTDAQTTSALATTASNACLITAVVMLLMLAVGISGVAIFFLLGPGSTLPSG
jgi:hypothetical protein